MNGNACSRPQKEISKRGLIRTMSAMPPPRHISRLPNLSVQRSFFDGDAPGEYGEVRGREDGRDQDGTKGQWQYGHFREDD